MNIESLCRKSIVDIRSKWELPNEGFLAGGSIANTIWNIYTGNKSPINDIDVYILENYSISGFYFEELKSKQHFKNMDRAVVENDYSGIEFGWKTNEVFIIESTKNKGIINFVNYSSNTNNPDVVLKYFDINCCQVGYDIKSDKFYYTENFIDFIKTGELRITNLSSPSHTAVRIVKKKNELNAILPDLELDILSYALSSPMPRIKFVDTAKLRFKERYADMYRKYKFELSDRFMMLEDRTIYQYFESIGIKCNNLYYLSTTPKFENIFKNKSIPISESGTFLYWVRNIMDNPYVENIWTKLHEIIDHKLGIANYLDIDVSEDDIDLLYRFIYNAKRCIENLKGFSISKQLDIIKKLLAYFKNDPIIAIEILEGCKLRDVDIDDEMNLLILELSVRKNIIDDNSKKVKKILYKEDDIDEQGSFDFL